MRYKPATIREGLAAFSLIELLVVAAVIGVLASLLLPVIARGRESSHRTVCISNLRQLHLAASAYADDYGDSYPVRTGGKFWPARLQPYFLEHALLVCPTDTSEARLSDDPDADRAPRSYVLNGFNDPAITRTVDESWSRFVDGPLQGTIKVTSIVRPEMTILLGEKTPGATAFYADLHSASGSFIEVLDHGRHGGSRAGQPFSRDGGANHAFVDGSIRFLLNGKSVCPENLWGVTDYFRTNYALCLF